MEVEVLIHSLIAGQSEIQQDKHYEDQKNKKVDELKQCIQDKYSKSFISVTAIKEDVYLLTFPLEIHVGILTTTFEIIIDFQQLQLQIHAYFTNKHGLIIVKSKLLRLSVCRYMLRLNNNLRVGSFFINPVYGQLGFNLQCNNNDQCFFESNLRESEFITYLDSLIVTAIHSLRFHFLRILFMINEINLKHFKVFENYMDNIRYQEENNPQKKENFISWRKLPKDAEILLSRIKKVVKNNMHLEFSAREYDEYGPLVQKQVTTDTKCLIQILPVEMNDLEVDKQFLISEGGFCNIYSKEIFYHLLKDGQKQPQSQKRPLVIKTDKNPQGEKVKKEIEIVIKLSETQTLDPRDQSNNRLKYFKFSGCCPYVAQFYCVPNKFDKVLMERYYHSSLDFFKAKQLEVLSLSTRVFIAHSIAMGLRYIHNYGIIHMDIKSANILISKTLMAKITDFGEAINKSKYSDKEKPGKTMPFCAPEIQQKLEPNQYTYAYDIYSFGVLLFELLFDRFPIDFRRQNLKPLEEKLHKLAYSVRYDENFDKDLGPQGIMKYLGRMCLQCKKYCDYLHIGMQPDPALRPNIDKMVLVLKDCLTYLDKQCLFPPFFLNRVLHFRTLYLDFYLNIQLIVNKMQKEDDMELEFKLMELNDVEETEFDKFMLNRPLIEKHFEELNFKHFDITQNEETKQWQLTITLEQFSNKFLALCTTTINFLRKRIDCKSFIAKPDGQLIQVKEKYLQRLLARYFCRINNSLRFGCFCIENETGQIQLKLNSVMISEHWTELICLHPMQSDGQNQGSLSSLLKVLHFTSHYAIGYHIYRLMHLINKLSYKVFPFLEQKLQDQYRKIPPQFDIYLQRINEIIQNKCTTPITEDETRQFQQHFNYPKQTNSSFKIMNFIKFSNPDQVDNGDGYELIGEGGFSIVKKGQLAFTLASNSGAGKSELEDISAQTKGNQASNIKENNQTKVEVEEHSVRQIQYVPNKEQEDVQAFIKRTIVIKKDKDREKDKQNEKADKKQPSRIILEKKILDILSQPLYDNQRRLIFNGYCPYIAQFYKADTIDKNNMPLFNEHLFMEFYQHTSLDNFRSKFQTTQSLNTRLYILFQIAHALRYLSYYGVIHNDLKPGNILIAKHYNAKLTDFGEAMYKKGDQVIIQGGDGRTLPFAAPESLSEESNNSQVNQPKIDHKSDIFSFGILMYEFLFEQYPIDFKKSNLANLQERYKNKTYQIRSNIDFIKTFGPKHLMKCLRNLAIKCLHHEPQNRPNIEWIIICLKEGLMYLEKMY